jgi:hypothetical protein
LRPIARKSRIMDETPFLRAGLGAVVLAAGALRVFDLVVMSAPLYDYAALRAPNGSTWLEAVERFITRPSR